MRERPVLLPSLIDGLQHENRKTAAIRYAKTVLDENSSKVFYLLFTILLTFDTVGLVDTVKEVVRRVNKQLAELSIIKPVSKIWIDEARKVLADTGAENCSGTFDQNGLHPYIGRFVQYLDNSTHNDLRLTSDLAYNVFLNEAS